MILDNIKKVIHQICLLRNALRESINHAENSKVNFFSLNLNHLDGMIELSGHFKILNYKEKIETYHQDLKKLYKNKTFPSKSKNTLQKELVYSKMLDKKGLQKLNLIKACQSKYKLLSKTVNRKQLFLKIAIEKLNQTVKLYKNMAPTMISGNSGKLLETSLDVVQITTKELLNISNQYK